jgi:hypothetical protein
VHPRDADAGEFLQLTKPSGRGVALHAPAVAVAQVRAVRSSGDGAVNGARHGR